MTVNRASTSGLLKRDLTALGELNRDEMVDLWSITYGHHPPKGISRRLLERAAAHEMQVAAFGGLKPKIRRKLLSRTTPSDSARSTGSCRNLALGTRLIREWNGRSHTVDVVEDGFEWNGELYRSLSAVAQAITGARWSGPRFFRL